MEEGNTAFVKETYTGVRKGFFYDRILGAYIPADTEFVQEKNTGVRKGFFYNNYKGGYVPAVGKPKNLKSKDDNKRFIPFVVIGIIGLLAYLFRDKLKALMLKKTNNGN
jgi:hypothetical protein